MWTRSSQEALRIDIDFELEIALWLGPGGKPFAQIVRQVEAAGGFEQDAKAIAALDHRERRFRRTQHLHMLVARCERHQPARKPFGAGAVTGGDDEARQAAERRIEGALARADLVLVKGLAVAGDERLHHGMLGLMGLQIADAEALVAAG